MVSHFLNVPLLTSWRSWHPPPPVNLDKPPCVWRMAHQMAWRKNYSRFYLVGRLINPGKRSTERRNYTNDVNSSPQQPDSLVYLYGLFRQWMAYFFTIINNNQTTTTLCYVLHKCQAVQGFEAGQFCSILTTLPSSAINHLTLNTFQKPVLGSPQIPGTVLNKQSSTLLSKIAWKVILF